MVSKSAVQDRVGRAARVAFDAVLDVLIVVVVVGTLALIGGLVGGLSIDGLLTLLLFGGIGIGMVGTLLFMATGTQSMTAANRGRYETGVAVAQSSGDARNSAGDNHAAMGIHEFVLGQLSDALPTPPAAARIGLAGKLMLASLFIVVAFYLANTVFL